MYSCQAKQYSIESKQFGEGRGVFSFVLMEGLYGLADANNDKRVSIKEIQRYLEDNVPLLALPNKQDPVIKAEDNTILFCDVNEELLSEYKTSKKKYLVFLSDANTKGNDKTLLASLNTKQGKLYILCMLQIDEKRLEEAYLTYKQYELLDKTSEGK